jgi:hypothetical protein
VRALLTASALTGLAALSLLLAACGGSSTPGVAAVGTATTAGGSSQQDGALAFAQCMRRHGVPDFPDPDAQGQFPSFRTGTSKQISARADGVCRHLLPSGGIGTPQQRAQKLTFALKVAHCLRSHGYPTFPDPTTQGQRIPPEINTESPQFQSTETSCEQQARKALGLR